MTCCRFPTQPADQEGPSSTDDPLICITNDLRLISSWFLKNPSNIGRVFYVVCFSDSAASSQEDVNGGKAGGGSWPWRQRLQRAPHLAVRSLTHFPRAANRSERSWSPPVDRKLNPSKERRWSGSSLFIYKQQSWGILLVSAAWTLLLLHQTSSNKSGSIQSIDFIYLRIWFNLKFNWTEVLFIIRRSFVWIIQLVVWGEVEGFVFRSMIPPPPCLTAAPVFSGLKAPPWLMRLLLWFNNQTEICFFASFIYFYFYF